jgi:signal transduction histidine kinase
VRRIRGELLYALAGFPWAVVSLVTVAAMLFVGTALSVTLVGLLVLPLALVTARSAAVVDRAMARRLLGITVDPPGPRRPGRGLVGWTRERLRDPAGWRALLYRVVKAPIALLAGAVSVIFWGYGLLALTYPAWWSFVPAQTDGHGHRRTGLGLLGDIYLDSWPYAVATAAVGAVLLVVAPWAVRAAVAPDAWLIRGLLGGHRRDERIRDLEQTRAHAVQDAATKLRAIERNLHDGAQPQLVALAMRLDMARTMLAGDTSPPDLDRILTLIDAAHRGATDAIADLRDLAQGIHPPILDSGLEAALHTVAARSAVPVDLSVTVPHRPSAAVETCLYFCATELVNNAAKHSGARRVTLDVNDRHGVIRLVVTDDGNGGVRLGGGTGLDGLIERLGAFDGRLHVNSRPGGPSTVTVEVPDHA